MLNLRHRSPEVLINMKDGHWWRTGRGWANVSCRFMVARNAWQICGSLMEIQTSTVSDQREFAGLLKRVCLWVSWGFPPQRASVSPIPQTVFTTQRWKRIEQV